ncbi:hypothetical protein GCM10010336_10450 [Streptomyces goshikiensis]|nr:hypothetical protein GCM10010336_10450 [Streptomyces goshikiensis]
MSGSTPLPSSTSTRQRRTGPLPWGCPDAEEAPKVPGPVVGTGAEAEADGEDDAEAEAPPEGVPAGEEAEPGVPLVAAEGAVGPWPPCALGAPPTTPPAAGEGPASAPDSGAARPSATALVPLAGARAYAVPISATSAAEPMTVRRSRLRRSAARRPARVAGAPVERPVERLLERPVVWPAGMV